MSSLRDLQSDFVRGLRGDASALNAWVLDGEFTAAERLRIYRNNYRISLRGALGDVYPVVHKLVGDGFFAYAADKFIAQHPSRSGNLHDFGESFAIFLGALQEASELVYLTDIARLEWAWHRAFHAAQSAVPDLSSLAQIPVQDHGRVRFRPAHGLSLIESLWPISRIWEAHQQDAEPEEAIDLGRGGEFIAVFRIDDDVQVTRLPEADFVMLQALSEDALLEVACDRVITTVADADVGAVLARVCTSGALGELIAP